MITRIKRYYADFISAILSALLLLFSFPPFNLSFLAWIALVPLFSVPKETSAKNTFIFYYSAGLVFWLPHIWWLNYVTSLGYVVLSAYLALFFGFFGLFLKFFRLKTDYPILFIAPPLWIIFELARTHLLIAFPWSLLGYCQWQNIPFIQISSITGIYGVSFLIVTVNAAIADFIFSKTRKHLRNLIFSFLIITATFVVGGKIILKEDINRKNIKISVIQGNIPQTEKWDEKYSEEIVNTYAELSIYAGTDHDISLVIWPETSYPDYININSALFQKVQNLTRYLDVPLLFGAVTCQNNKDYNSALLILPDGEINQIYNKIHLVPFAEYIPLKNFLFFLGNIFPQIGNFSEGNEYTVFRTPITPARFRQTGGDNRKPSFAVLICFEDLFPDLSRNFVNKGASFLVVITNDAHFNQSPALWQHFTHSVFRAVENRRPVVRAANNGISGFIDSYGRPVKILNEDGKAAGARGFTAEKIMPSDAETFYTRFGDLFVYINVFYLLVILSINAKKKL
ncbi:MAG: apolipoprotein N-acyltransferase [Candidatus Ratteibacteria bacterium]|nr:apolipoprotein N-acyltransferase [Candidatus Ratteibacteria bacterium]